MTIHLYALCWNDDRMLGFFFRHYDRFVDRYIIFDDGSSDASRAILSAHPRVELRDMPANLAGLGVTERALELWNGAWKESRGSADWVFVTEIDEHLEYPELLGYLAGCKASGVTIVPALGFQMLSPVFPDANEMLCATRTLGAPFMQQSKLSIFDPSAVDQIAYAAGRHVAAPTGRVIAPSRDELVNRHYKYLGPDYVYARNQALGARLTPRDGRLAHRWRWGKQELLEDWEQFSSCLVNLAAPDFEPDAVHPAKRWWEPFRVKNIAASEGAAFAAPSQEA
jgi:hypothetical protein